MFDEVVKAIGPLLTGALAVVVPALAALALAWLKLQTARLEAQRQAALGAVCEVEAETKPRRELTAEEKHAAARERIASRLPPSVRPAAEKLDELVVEAVAREKARPTSDPPAG